MSSHFPYGIKLPGYTIRIEEEKSSFVARLGSVFRAGCELQTCELEDRLARRVMELELKIPAAKPGEDNAPNA